MCNAKHEPLVGLVGGPPVHHGRVVKRRVIEEVVYHPLRTRSHWLADCGWKKSAFRWTFINCWTKWQGWTGGSTCNSWKPLTKMERVGFKVLATWPRKNSPRSQRRKSQNFTQVRGGEENDCSRRADVDKSRQVDGECSPRANQIDLRTHHAIAAGSIWASTRLYPWILRLLNLNPTLKTRHLIGWILFRNEV